MASHEPRLQATEKPVPLTGISKAIKRFNRNTTWVATGLLAPVIFAAVMVVLQERHAKAYNLTEEARQATVDPLVNANPVANSDIGGSNEKSTAQIASGQATNVDRGLIPNQPNVLVNVTPSSPPERTDSARVIHTKTPSGRHRSSIRRSIVDVRSRLIALWHQSLRENLAAGPRSRTQTNGKERTLVTPPQRAIDATIRRSKLATAGPLDVAVLFAPEVGSR